MQVIPDMALTPDFLDVRVADIDTPDALYQRHRILYTDGAAHIIARSGYAIVVADGSLTMTGPHAWRLDTAAGPWTITRLTKGCNCSGQPIIPKGP